MKISQDLIANLDRLGKAVKYFQSEGFRKNTDPYKIAKLRTELAVIVFDVGTHVAEAKRAVGAAKRARRGRYIEIRKEGKTVKDADTQADWDCLEEEHEAEYWYNRIKGAHDDAADVLNALASEIKTLELQAKNLS